MTANGAKRSFVDELRQFNGGKLPGSDERRGIPEFLSTEHATETGFSPGSLGDSLGARIFA
jgi:hypothetical protein